MGIRLFVVGLEGEAYKLLLVRLHASKHSENIGILHQVEVHAFGAVFLELVVGTFRRTVVSHSGGEDGSVAVGKYLGGGGIHLTGTLHAMEVDTLIR